MTIRGSQVQNHVAIRPYLEDGDPDISIPILIDNAIITIEAEYRLVRDVFGFRSASV